MIIDPFSEEEKQKAQEQKPPIQEQEQKPLIQENTAETMQKPQITLDSIKKEFKNQSITLSKLNLARLKVLSKIQHIPQSKLLDTILDDHFATQNYADDIKKMIEQEKNLI